jgi:endonuclease-3
MNKHKVHDIFSRFQQADPAPTTELIYHNHFELLIAVILSAQATDVSVNKATIGLYNTKAANIIKTCQMLTTEHHGKVPTTRADLEALPGVGRKTANVILNTCFGEATIAVDTHIFRVANRTGLAKGKTPLAVENQLLKIIPKAFLRHAHHWLILHGRYTCTARKPRCPTCLINDLCEFKAKTTVVA